ncbi:hypothetical protein EYF80_062014 [Liparis tanakae]|uniref:Uncharacterized protein n=1 Tax=Liparis tanakae TaxID=230148 RepID=A0A4Z2EGF1_9TELE|nr:hypothetical protein EYF80_062014 [Liparis tanakae]
MDGKRLRRSRPSAALGPPDGPAVPVRMMVPLLTVTWKMRKRCRAPKATWRWTPEAGRCPCRRAPPPSDPPPKGQRPPSAPTAPHGQQHTCSSTLGTHVSHIALM